MASTQESGEKRQMGGELIIPVVALVFTLYYISTVIKSPWTAQLNAFMVGSVLILLVLLFLGHVVREVLADRATLGFGTLLEPYEMLPKRLGFIAISLGYLLIMQWVGFTLATFLFMGGSMMLLGNGRWPVFYLVTALLMAVIALAVFIILFQKRFPKGPVEYLLQALT